MSYQTPPYATILGASLDRSLTFHICGRVYIGDKFVALRFINHAILNEVVDVPIELFPSNFINGKSQDTFNKEIFPFFDSPKAIPPVKLDCGRNVNDLPIFFINTDWSCEDYNTIFYPNMCYRTNNLDKDVMRMMADVSSIVYDTDFIPTFFISSAKCLLNIRDSVTITLGTNFGYLGVSEKRVMNMLSVWARKNGLPEEIFSYNDIMEEIEITLNKNINLPFIKKTSKEESQVYNLQGAPFTHRLFTSNSDMVVTLLGNTSLSNTMYPNYYDMETKIYSSTISSSILQKIIADDYGTIMLAYKQKGNDLEAYIKFAPVFSYSQLEAINSVITAIEKSSYLAEIKLDIDNGLNEVSALPSTEAFRMILNISVDMNSFGEDNHQSLLNLIQEEMDVILRDLYDHSRLKNFRCNCVAVNSTADDELSLVLMFKR